jgi:hypothetical protein
LPQPAQDDYLFWRVPRRAESLLAVTATGRIQRDFPEIGFDKIFQMNSVGFRMTRSCGNPGTTLFADSILILPGVSLICQLVC